MTNVMGVRKPLDDDQNSQAQRLNLNQIKAARREDA